MDKVERSKVPDKHSVCIARVSTRRLFRPRVVRTRPHSASVKTKCWAHVKPAGQKRQNYGELREENKRLKKGRKEIVGVV